MGKGTTKNVLFMQYLAVHHIIMLTFDDSYQVAVMLGVFLFIHTISYTKHEFSRSNGRSVYSMVPSAVMLFCLCLFVSM